MASSPPNSVTIDDKEYYKADDIRTFQPAYFVGCNDSLLKIIKRRNIPVEAYIRRTYVKKTNTWNACSERATKATLLLEKNWVHANVPGFDNDVKLDIERAPPVLELNDNEKLRDIDGNIMDVEVRGIRDRKGCYFKASDIAKAFEMPNLNNTMTNNNNNYEENVHYKTFISSKQPNNLSAGNRQLFLTYSGLIRIIYASRSNNADKFREWAEDILFTAQLGTVEQKNKLANKLLGVSIEDTRAVLNKVPVKVNGLYLICVGQVKNMKEGMPELSKYDDSEYVLKYGRSEDLSTRFADHNRKLSKLKGASELSIVMYAPVDEAYLSDAELELKQGFEEDDVHLDHPVYKELVVMSEKRITQYKKIFRSVCERYAGNVKSIQDILNRQAIEFEYEKRNLVKDLEHERELHNMTKKLLDNSEKILEESKKALENSNATNEKLMQILLNIKPDRS